MIQPIDTTCYQPLDTSHPYLRYDIRRCDGCGRCVRYAQTIACCDALELTEPADRRKVRPVPGHRLIDSDCFACGGCVDICVSSAFTHARGKNGNTSRPAHTVDTHCCFCGLACPVRYTVDDQTGTIRHTDPINTLPPVDLGRGNEPVHEPLCPQARYAWEFTTAAERLTRPILKVKRQSQPIAWIKAIDHTARAINTLIETHGPDAVAVILHPGAVLEDITAAIQFAQHALGQSTVFFLPDIPHDIPAGRWADSNELLSAVGNADRVGLVNLTGEPLDTPSALAARVRRLVRAGAAYVGIDPATEPTNEPDKLNGRILAVDPLTFLEHLAEGHTPLKDHRQWFIFLPDRLVSDYSRRVARLVDSIGQTTDQRFRFLINADTVNVTALGDYIRTHHPNVRIGRTDELITALLDTTIHAAYIVGADPIRELPGGLDVATALHDLDLVILHDVFPTQTAQLADIVFPIPTWLEVNGTVLTDAGQTATIGRIVKPPRNARTTPDILTDLAQRITTPARKVQTPPNAKPQQTAAPQHVEPIDAPAKVNLVVRPTPWHRDNAKLTGRTSLNRIQNYDAVHINPDDATTYDINDGEPVVLQTDHAHIVVDTVLDNRIRTGWAKISNNFDQTCAQILWPPHAKRSDPIPVTVIPFRPEASPTGALLSEDQQKLLRLRRYGRTGPAVDTH